MKKLLNRIFGRLKKDEVLRKREWPYAYPYKIEFMTPKRDEHDVPMNAWVKSRTSTIKIHIGDGLSVEPVVVCFTPDIRENATLLGTFNGVNIYKE